MNKTTKRRGRGEGSVQLVRRSRTTGNGFTEFWRGYFTVKRNGKRRVVYARTKPELLDKLKAEQSKERDGLDVFLKRDSKQTVAEFMEGWLELRRQNKEGKKPWRLATYTQNECVFRVHIKESAFGALRLADLTSDDEREMLLAGMENADVGVRTRQQARGLLHQALKYAVRKKLLARFDFDDISKPVGEKRDMHPLTEENVEAFIPAARGEPLGNLYIIAVTTGMRQGELRGLCWADVDLKNRSIFVSKTLTKDENGQHVRTDPKTTTSKRRVELPAVAVTALRDQQQRLLAAGLRASDWVFPLLASEPEADGTRKAEPLSKEQVQRGTFARILERAGLATIRFHDLRHTWATVMLRRGVHPKVVQEQLGHSSIMITLDIYSQYVPSMGRAAADTWDRLDSVVSK